jgi:hypothetical protein
MATTVGDSTLRSTSHQTCPTRELGSSWLFYYPNQLNCKEITKSDLPCLLGPAGCHCIIHSGRSGLAWPIMLLPLLTMSLSFSPSSVELALSWTQQRHVHPEHPPSLPVALQGLYLSPSWKASLSCERKSTHQTSLPTSTLFMILRVIHSRHGRRPSRLRPQMVSPSH